MVTKVASEDKFAGVTARQMKAIEVMPACGDVTQAAEAAGVARKTIYAWLKQDAFAAALHTGESEKLVALSRGSMAQADRAVETLAAAMNDSAPPALRVRAADPSSGRLIQIRDLASLGERVTALEANLKELDESAAGRGRRSHA